jgi:hypothetical protein
MQKSFGYVQLDHALVVMRRIDRQQQAQQQQPTVQHLFATKEFGAK